MKLPFFTSQDTVTLVIDTVAVRVLMARGDAVTKWASAPLEDGLVVEGTIQQPEEVGKVVAELFQKEGIPRNRVITCVSGANALHKVFALPAIRQEDLSNAVIYQLKREMPVPLEELVMTWQLVSSGDRQHQVFAIGVPRDIVGGFLETLRHAGVRPKSLDVKPLALARAAQRATAIVGNVEADSVDVVCLLDYVPVLIRSVYFPVVASSSQELGRRLADELQRGIRFYNDTNRQQPVGANTPVFLSGGASDYFSLVEALYGSLEYTIERLNPTLTYPSDFPLEEYAANLGLALKGK